MKNLLFVDDEPALLEGLRRRLYRARSKWEMTFVPSAADAIAELGTKPYDAIISDMRMARMDGAQLLDFASRSSPETIRIVLSGFSDERQVMRLVPLSHQYIAKPCEPEQLEHIIERCMQLQDLLHAPRVRAAVGRIRKLPTLPRVYSQLRQIIRREDASAAEIAEVIAGDSALTAKILHVVNSAFFRHARPISRIEQAVVHLGFDAVRNLTLSAEIFCSWSKSAEPAGFDPERLQDHARKVALGAYALAGRNSWADDALLAGLLHDIGYWVLLQQCPEEMVRAIRMAEQRGLPLYEAERQVLEATHGEVGAYLLGLWGMPYPILEAVAFHHDPSQAQQVEFDRLAAVAVAQEIIAKSETDRIALRREDWSPAVNAQYLAALKAPFSWAEAAQIVHSSVNQESPSND